MTGGGFIEGDKFDKITDPLGLAGGKAGKWADPLGIIMKPPKEESAADRAARLEAERQARIADTQKRINTVFDDPARAAQITDAINAARERDMLDLDRQKGDNDRQLRFALARGGQIGGSTQRDQQQTLGEDYTRGLLNVESRSQALGADLSARDQDARARLISLATSGLDATTGASQAAAAMKSNLEGAQSAAYGQSLGDSFGSVGSFIKESKDAAQRRRANQDAYGRIGLYGGTQGYGG